MKISYSKSRYSKPPFAVIKEEISKTERNGKDPFPCTFCNIPLYTFNKTWYIPMMARLCSEECANMFILSEL